MECNNIVSLVLEKVQSLSNKNGYDKYIKKHSLVKMFCWMLMQHCWSEKYGRSLMMKLNFRSPETAISQGEISKKLAHKLPLFVWENIYRFLLFKLEKTKNKMVKKLYKKLKIIDSSSLQASLSMRWAKHRKTSNGLKLHMLINSSLAPEDFRLKNGNTSDKKWLKWAINKGFIYVFDRGYNCYKVFRYIINKGAFFVTRALSNIQYDVIKERRVSKKHREKGILSDKEIEVIVDKKNMDKIKLRLISFRFVDSNNKEYVFNFLTNIFDMSSVEIAEIYKQRWQIETFFQWIKVHLQLSHWISRSEHGVKLQFYSALIIFLMVKLAEAISGMNFRYMKDFCHCFDVLFEEFFKTYRYRKKPT